MNRMKWMMPATLTVILVLMAAPLAAQTEINETRPLDGSARNPRGGAPRA